MYTKYLQIVVRLCGPLISTLLGAVVRDRLQVLIRQALPETTAQGIIRTYIHVLSHGIVFCLLSIPIQCDNTNTVFVNPKNSAAREMRCVRDVGRARASYSRVCWTELNVTMPARF